MKKRATKTAVQESDNDYFLKILVYFVLGTIWLKYDGMPVVPIGLILGAIVARRDHFTIDRKIEYAILLVATLLGLAGYGLFFALPPLGL
jgi:hypothetical protein